MSDHTLTVAGERAEAKEEKEMTFHLLERLEKRVERSFTLPVDADIDAMKATFETLVLRVHVPNVEAAKPRKIEIAA